MEILTESADFILAHDAATGWLHVRWQGLQPVGAIEAHCALLLEQVHRTGSTKILNDSAQDEDGWAQLIGWLARDFFPQLAARGVVAVAWVLPGNLRARGDVNRAVSAIARPLTDVFADTEAAYSWLHHLPAAGAPPPCLCGP